MTEAHTEDLLEQLSLFSVPQDVAERISDMASTFHQMRHAKERGLPEAILQEQRLGLDAAYHRLLNAVHAEIQAHSRFANKTCSCGTGATTQCTSFEVHAHHDMEKRGHCPGRVITCSTCHVPVTWICGSRSPHKCHRVARADGEIKHCPGRPDGSGNQ